MIFVPQCVNIRPRERLHIWDEGRKDKPNTNSRSHSLYNTVFERDLFLGKLKNTWSVVTFQPRGEGESRFRRGFRLSRHVEGGVRKDKVLPPVGKSAKLQLPFAQGLLQQC